jgi:hypothetical protein
VTPSRIHFHLEVANYGQEVHLYAQTTGGVAGDFVHRLQPVVFKKLSEEESMTLYSEPAMTMRVPQAQQLMDELWRVGFRPVHGAPNDGERGALTRHLEDMRAIAFAKAEVPKP